MVASNPLFRGKWTLKRFNATVINDVWPEVLFFSLVATMVWTVTEFTSHSLSISNAMLTVLGTVLGLVISFRTSSAYERYQEGRKMWSNISIASRNLALMIWIHVAFEREDKDKQKKQSILQSAIEKKSYVNLIQAFSVSVKHYLRGEPGPYYEDLYPLICFLPRYATPPPAPQVEADMLPLWLNQGDEDETTTTYDDAQTKNPRSAAQPSGHKQQRTSSLPEEPHANELDDGIEKEKQQKRGSWFDSLTLTRKRGPPRRKDTFDPEKALPSVKPEKPLKPARSPPEETILDYIPLLRFFKWIASVVLRTARPKNSNRNAFGKKRKTQTIDSNVPLEICLYLSSYTAFLMKSGLLQPAMATGMANNIASLQDIMTNLDRIRNTPLPFAYQAHLRMSLWIYLFFLPFQIVSQFRYLAIPGTAFASFLLLGFLEIGQEIEDPFSYDANDLDLDAFCLTIQRELHEITAHTSPDPDTFLFSHWNQPFAPADRTSAADLTKGEKHEYRWPGHGMMNGEEHHEGYAAEPGMASIRRTLLKSWRDVDDITRQ